MEQEEVINSGLAIWIDEYILFEPSPPVWTVDGFPLDGYHGFGSNRPHYFHGEVALLTLNGKFIQNLLISRVHRFQLRSHQPSVETAKPLLSEEPICLILNSNWY